MKEATIKGWMARDERVHKYHNLGRLHFYEGKPHRVKLGYPEYKTGFWYPYEGEGIELFPTLSPEITWESEPREAEITIKIKE